jgi:hypothetical protein
MNSDSTFTWPMTKYDFSLLISIFNSFQCYIRILHENLIRHYTSFLQMQFNLVIFTATVILLLFFDVVGYKLGNRKWQRSENKSVL